MSNNIAQWLKRTPVKQTSGSFKSNSVAFFADCRDTTGGRLKIIVIHTRYSPVLDGATL